MVNLTVIFGTFLVLVLSSFLYFWGVFDKTILPLALVGYEVIIANEPTRPREIMDHFSVFCRVTCPLNSSKAGGGFVLIQTSLHLFCNSSCCYANCLVFK